MLTNTELMVAKAKYTRWLLLICIAGATALDNGLGITPPMGWSSWNYFTYDINETIALQIGAALVSTGQ